MRSQTLLRCFSRRAPSLYGISDLPALRICITHRRIEGTAMAALDWITVKGFRSIGDIEKLRLSSINVLIGANGSGKSNFINVFSFLREVREGRLQQYV